MMGLEVTQESLENRMFGHLPFVGFSLATLSFGWALQALAAEPLPAKSPGPDIVAMVRPLLEDLKSAEYSQSRCLLAPILAADKRTIAFSRDNTFHAGDQIVAINGEPLSTISARALHDILVKYPAEATLKVRLSRLGSETEVTAPCSDNQLFYGMLRAAATAAALDEAATCADRMADVGKHHALSATWLNVALQCRVKAGRVAGAPMAAEYFDVYHQALLENSYSAEALKRARPSLQAAARKLLQGGSRPLAEKLQQEYAAAVANVAPQLAGPLSLQLDADVPIPLNNAGGVQQSPTVIATQNGKVTNMTIAGQLAAKHPVDCVGLSTLDNSRTPPDLYLGVSACIQKNDYLTAAALFALAGIESHFDAERVSDKSAGQAGQVLIMTTFNALPDDKRQEFQKAVTGLNADPKGMEPICRAIEKIGFPTYYPEYMVLHGIHAFTAKPGDATLVADFNAPTTWNFLLTNYLSCHDVPAVPPASTQRATVAKQELPADPNPMTPGLYQFRSNIVSQAPDLRNEEPQRLCFTPALIAAANLVPQAGQCNQLNTVHKGNTTYKDLSCMKNGVVATGRSTETLEGNKRYSVIDLTTTDNTGTHPLHLVTEMIFLGPVCNATYADSSATTKSPNVVASSGALTLERELPIEIDVSTTPHAIKATSDGGVLVTLDSFPPQVLKLNASGAVEWKFEEPTPSGGGVTYIRMAAPDHASGVILCAAREHARDRLTRVPSAVIRLNDHGQEIARLDAATGEVHGGIFYEASGCIPWQDGYVVVAREPRPAGEPDDFGHVESHLRDRTTVMRLRADLSIQWRKPIRMYPNSTASTAGPRALPNGDLILPDLNGMTLIDGDGRIKAHTAMPACGWLRTAKPDNRIRLSCSPGNPLPLTPITIYEYDGSLQLVSKLPLGTKDNGQFTVIELADGRFTVLGANEDSQPPFIVLYGATGKELGRYTYLKKWSTDSSHGYLVDGVATGPAQIATLRLSEHHDHFISIITWINTK
jgi:hypothetical protein